MGVKGITIDSHTLVWYVDKTLKGKRLSKIALEMIKEAESESVIYISAISLMEILDLVEKKRISVSFQTVLSAIEKNDAYLVVNAAMTYRFAFGSGVYLTIRGEVHNLFNALYTMNGEGQEFFPAAERNYVFGISLQL